MVKVNSKHYLRYVCRLVGKNSRNLRHFLRTPKRRIIAASLACLMVVAVVLPLVSMYNTNRRYVLTPAVERLLGAANRNLTQQLAYDSQSDAYYLNKKGITSNPAAAGNNPQAVAQALEQQRIGSGSGKQTAKDMLYSAKLPTDPTKGVTYYDDNTGLSFTVTPNFKLMNGRDEQGRVVYPYDDNTQLVYTAKGNGLKEDLVMKEPSGDSLQLSYSLQLPDTLEARMLNDGSGALGIYSADPALFGNISYGSNVDQAKVESARVNAKKDNLVFALPAPQLKSANGSLGGASAQFVLSSDHKTLTVATTNLNEASYPLSIDPSVVITSTNDFSNAVGDNDNIDFSTAGQINRGGVSGGNVDTWSTTTSITTSISFFGTVVYNGNIYTVGGSNTGAPGSGNILTVSYAAINSNGTIGTWNTTTSLPSNGLDGLASQGVVAYNGYMYDLGGSAGGAPVNSVYYAPINANGTLGSWNATTSFITARLGLDANAYNGYMYILGGCVIYYGGTCYNDVQYAPINANGTLGSWNSTSSFTTGRGFFGSAEYNGYLYVVAGRNAGQGLQTDVQYAPINSNGTLGSWIMTSSYVGSTYFSAFAYDGYLYSLGGYSGGYTYQTYYAPIYANGAVGTWTAVSNNFTTPREGLGAVAYNGDLYILGGSNGGSTYYSDVQYAQLKPEGATGSYHTTDPMYTALWGQSSVAYNGYLYVLGGRDNSGTYHNDVQYAPINSDGSIGSWASTTAFTNARWDLGAVAYNGYFYIFGGNYWNGSSNVDYNDVQYAPINSNGSIGSWTATTSFTTGEYFFGSAVYNGYIYMLGGYNDTSGILSSVEYAPINSNGTVGSWSSGTGLGTAVYALAAVVYNGYLYAIGGSASSNDVNTVQYASINSNGSIGSWNNTTGFTNAREQFAAVVSNGYIYIIGGISNGLFTYSSSVEYAPINSNGTVGSWTSATPLGTGVRILSATVYNGYLYVMGGQDSSSVTYNTVQYVSLGVDGSGATGSWTATASFTNGRTNHATVVYNGYMYILGGYYSGVAHSDVQYAPINGDGTVGSWASTASFTTVRYGLTAMAYNGYMYILGGSDGSTYLSDVQYAPINSNGTLGSWTATTGFSNGRYLYASVTYNGYMYILGGDGISGAMNDVQYAPINSNGTVGSWNTTTGFATARYYLTSAVYNGYMYILGGEDGSSNTLNDVQYAPINSNGTVGSWNTTSSFNDARYGLASATYNGYIYILGGWDGTSTLTNVQYAPINSNGTLGSWTATTGFSNARDGHTAVAYKGYVYILGGGSGGTDQSDVQYSPLNSIASIGQYSTLVNFGAESIPQSVTYNGQLSGGISNISYRLAGSNGVFGSAYPASSLPLYGGGSAPNCTAGNAGDAYLELIINFDDTQTTTFPNSSANNSYLTDVTVNYTGLHPTPNVRLRGGQYFSTGSYTIQPLDTCH